MQRAVAVLFGRGDVVVKLVGNIAPQAMDYAQYGVTIAHRGHQNTHRANVIYLWKRDALALHFAPDAVNVFGPPAHRTFNTGFFQLTAQPLQQLVDIFLAR